MPLVDFGKVTSSKKGQEVIDQLLETVEYDVLKDQVKDLALKAYQNEIKIDSLLEEVQELRILLLEIKTILVGADK